MKIPKQTLIIISAVVLVISLSIFVYLQFFNNSGNQQPAKVETKAANQTYSKSIDFAKSSGNVTPIAATPSPTVALAPTVIIPSPTKGPSPTSALTDQSAGTSSATTTIAPTEIALASPVPSVTKTVTTQLPITGTITTSLIMFSTSLAMIIVAFVF